MLSLNEIKNHEFKRGIGYSKKSVNEFISEVVDAYDEVCKENVELKDKIVALSEGIQYYKSIEKTLQKALILAQKTSDEEQDKAVKNARIIEKEARFRADKVLTKAKYDLDTIFRQTDDLNRRFELYKAHVKNLITTQLELINSDAYNISINDLEGYIKLKEKLEDAKDIDPEKIKAEEVKNSEIKNENIKSENAKIEEAKANIIKDNETVSKVTKEGKVHTEKNETTGLRTEETHSAKVNAAPIKENLISRIPDETVNETKTVTRSFMDKGETENLIKRPSVSQHKNGEIGHEQKNESGN